MPDATLFIRELPDGILLGQRWLKISKKPIAEIPYRM